MESSDDLEPEIDFSPVTKRRCDKYSSELCVFCHKSENVDSPGRETVQSLFSVKNVCKLRLENDPHNFGSDDIEQIWQSYVQRKPKWQRHCYQHFTKQSKQDRLLPNQPSECVSEKRIRR